MGDFVTRTGESLLVGGGLRLARGSIAKAKRKFDNLPIVTVNQLKAGDILIVKDFSERGHDPDGDSIRGGQAIFSRMSGGNCASEHVMLVREDGRPHVIESNNGGVNARDFISSRIHAVYRYTGEAQSIVLRETVGVANFLCNGHRLDSHMLLTTGAGPASDYASRTKLAASVFRAKFRGASYKRRISRIAREYESGNRVQRGKYKMICSEFAATCFEVGAWVCHALSPLGADPRAMTAKALEGVLNRRNFQLVGRFQGDVSHTIHQQLLGAGIIGPLVAIGDREIRAGNTLANLVPNAEGHQVGALQGLKIHLGGVETQIAVVTFSDSFRFLTQARATPRADYAYFQGYDYIYTNAPQWMVERHGVLYLALRAPE